MKSKKTNRALSIVLSILLVISLCPRQIQKVEAATGGTTITSLTEEQLEYFYEYESDYEDFTKAHVYLSSEFEEAIENGTSLTAGAYTWDPQVEGYKLPNPGTAHTIDSTRADIAYMDSMFYGLKFSDSNANKKIDLTLFDTTNVTDMSYMFSDTNIKRIDFGTGFYMQKVTNVSHMFANSSSLEQLVEFSPNLSSAKSTYAMFSGCKSLNNSAFNYINFTNTGKIEYFDEMFADTGIGLASGQTTDKDYGYTVFKQIMEKFDFSSAKSMSLMFGGTDIYCNDEDGLSFADTFKNANPTDINAMFFNCKNLKKVDFSGLTNSNATNVQYLFYGCSGLESVKGLDTIIDTDINSLAGLFNGCTSLTDEGVTEALDGVDTSAVQNFSFMFSDCTSLEELDLNNLDTSSATNLGRLFEGCTNLKKVDISSWNTEKVASAMDNGFFYMFADCVNLEYINLGNISLAGIGEQDKYNKMHDMFKNTSSEVSEKVYGFAEDEEVSAYLNDSTITGINTDKLEFTTSKKSISCPAYPDDTDLNKIVDFKSTYTFPKYNGAKIEGKHFKNWLVDGTAYKPGDEIEVLDNMVINAVFENHTWNEGVLTKAPTATEEGIITYTCKACGDTYEEKVPKSAPDESASPSANPTESISPSSVPSANPAESTVPSSNPAETTSPSAEAPTNSSVTVKKGSVVTDKSSKAKYTVIKPGKGGTVAYKATTNKNAATLTIPATVKIDGISYKVVEIKANAFKNNKKLKKITIGKNVKTIGKNAFLNCANLKTIIVKTSQLTMKTVGAKAFKGIHKKAVARVPKKKLTLYKKVFKKKGMNGKKQKIKK